MSKRLLSSCALALPISVAFVWIGGEALGRKPLPEPAAATVADGGTKIAVVNMTKIMSNEDPQWTMHLSGLTQSIDTEKKAKEGDLNRLEEAIKSESDAAKREVMTDDYARKRALAQEWLKLKQIEVDRETALHWQDLYRLLRNEVKTIASQNGIDLVLFDDSMDELKTDDRQNQPKKVQVASQMLSMHVLHASNKIDITDQVITRMNNVSKATPGGSAKPSGSTTGGAQPTGQ